MAADQERMRQRITDSWNSLGNIVANDNGYSRAARPCLRVSNWSPGIQSTLTDISSWETVLRSVDWGSWNLPPRLSKLIAPVRNGVDDGNALSCQDA